MQCEIVTVGSRLCLWRVKGWGMTLGNVFFMAIITSLIWQWDMNFTSIHCTCSSTATLNSCQIQFSRPWKFSLHMWMSLDVNVLVYLHIHLRYILTQDIYMYIWEKIPLALGSGWESLLLTVWTMLDSTSWCPLMSSEPRTKNTRKSLLRIWALIVRYRANLLPWAK